MKVITEGFISLIKKVISKSWRTTSYLNEVLRNNSQACTLSYIPSRLKRNNRSPILTFEVGENLFYRCKREELDNPYLNISITELSHNRSGLSGDQISWADDALFNIKPENLFERYLDREICVLEIKSLTQENLYRKHFSETKQDVESIAVIELLHDPDECMYPHSIFRVYFNGEIVTYSNYKATLGKHQKIRNKIKEELASMIRRKQVHQTDSPQD